MYESNGLKAHDKEEVALKRFVLDRASAREWLTAAIVAHELDLESSNSQPSANKRLPINIDWDPQAPGQEDIVRELVRAAQQEITVMECPQGAALDLEHLDDGDDWCFRFVLSLDTPAPLLIAGPPRAISQLRQGATCGIEAAMSILDQAEMAGNTLLSQLALYVAKAT